MPESHLAHRISDHLIALYPDTSPTVLQQWVAALEGRVTPIRKLNHEQPKWSEQTALVIAYGDSVSEPDVAPLKTLGDVFQQHLAPAFSSLHVLPYYPATSDDGFSVQDYHQIDPALGTWADVEALGQQVQLMADLVLNHCSQSSVWFQRYLAGDPEYQDFFYSPSPDFDYSQLVRPRPQPVLQTFQGAQGPKELWCTFSRDQVDLNYQNPQVLFAMLDVVLMYLRRGARILRLDAVAFLWKRSGSTCVNEPQTHEIIRLIRTLVEVAAPDAILVTETNLPNQENLSYFGNGNEAHWVYNFPLPPLVSYALLMGQSDPLRRWAMSLPPALPGMTYLNFVASHDGMGLRPTEGLLDEHQFQAFIDQLTANGARISLRTTPDGQQKPYEANITLFSALSYCPQDPHGDWASARFLAAHAIMLGLEGVPAVYFNNLVSQENDQQAVEESSIPRRINRTKYTREDFFQKLSIGASAQVFSRLQRMLKIRQNQAAFHPNATQFTLQLPSHFFGVWRQSLDRRSNLFAVTNLSAQPQCLPLSSLNLVTGQVWFDLLEDALIEESQLEVNFSPYQTRWISRRS